MNSKSVLALLAFALILPGCGGGGRQATSSGTSQATGRARFDVDVRTGKVTVTQPSGRAVYEGGSVVFSSSDLIVTPGDSGQRVIRVTAQDKSGQPWGSYPVRLVVSDLRDSDDSDVRIRVRVRTRAGSGSPGDSDGSGSAAAFRYPAGLALGQGAHSGTLCIGDLNGPTIRAMQLDGMVSTLAGSPGVSGRTDGTGSGAAFMGPHGVATDASGNVYVADDYGFQIRRITPLGQVTTIAGTGAYGVQDGNGSVAKFAYPSGVAVSSDGDRIYVCERTGHTIRRIAYLGSGPRDRASSYEVTTIAGTAFTAGYADGTGTAALFSDPYGLALVEGAGTDLLLVADSGNGRVRRIDTPQPGLARVSTIAGTGSSGLVDGPGSAARFVFPDAVCASWSATSGLFALVADGNALRAVVWRGGSEPTQAGNYQVTTIAGDTAQGFSDGDGYTARFWGLSGIAMVSTGGNATTAYVSDANNFCIREVSIPSGELHHGGTAGTGSDTVRLITYDDEVPNQNAWRRTMTRGQTGYETYLQFYVPHTASGFSFYASIETDSEIVNLPARDACTLTTLAGNGVAGGNDGPGKMARLASPSGVAAVPARLAGAYYATSGGAVRAVFTDAHRIRAIDQAGRVTTLAGSAVPGFADGMAGAAAFSTPVGIALASDGSLIVADSGNHRIRRVWPNGLVATIAGSSQGASDGTGATALFNTPMGVEVTDGGVIYVADSLNHAVRRLTLRAGADPRSPAAYTVTTVAGSLGVSGFVDGAGSVARFNQPVHMASAPDGALYVADSNNGRIRVLQDVGAQMMSVSTLGVALNGPVGVDLDAAGNIYVSEQTSSVISRINRGLVRHELMGSLGSGFVDGMAGRLSSPGMISFKEGGSLLVADTGNHALRALQRVIEAPNQSETAIPQ
ncbi:MAG: hypothetical protein GX446_12075 [Chthonomonadales bacterium]|nr:hypothetical protein [Chthonomonadales bacterium]